ncbi:SGNH/GDSL hydrolase family protein [Priestia aryabhattai]|uniref:SGNH/GDSL hydrolase family protein n=1 Tax=Priestia aryabhattai TaxID=412384 RepID=UPI002E1DA176|nr:SGNH/GDSL hydrolase family protein [Priestia aryabhattai]MED4261365.1 SGNH/GDSL hydrolase family protein [Priestia aryabhattai]
MRYRLPNNEWDVNFAEDYSKNLQDIDKEFTSLVQRIANLIISASSGEIQANDARLDTLGILHKTLKERVDSDVLQLLELAAKKADQAYVETMLAAAISGAPKGFYNTFSALNSAYPQGTDGVFLVLENGHIYIWNGTAWADAGVYQGIEVPINSVSKSKLTKDIQDNISFAKSLMGSYLYDFFSNGYKQIIDDTGAGTASGFMKDVGFTTAYDTLSKSATITYPSLSASKVTANELFINNNDLMKIKTAGSFELHFGFKTEMILSKVSVSLYSVNGASVTLLDEANVLTNPNANQLYFVDRTFLASLIPENAQALRVYIKIEGYSSGNKTITLSEYRTTYNAQAFSNTDVAKAWDFISKSITLPDASVGVKKLEKQIETSINTMSSILDITNLFNTLDKGYQKVTVDTGAAPQTGFMSDVAGYFTTTFDSQNDIFTVSSSGKGGSLNEFVISNTDMLEIKGLKGFTVGYNLTPLTLTPVSLYMSVYSVKGTTATSIYTKTIANAPTAGTKYVVEEFIDSSLIPADAECLRVYLFQGTPVQSGSVKVGSYYLSKGDTKGAGHPSSLKSEAKPFFNSFLGIEKLSNRVSTNENDLSQIKPQLLQGVLTKDMLYSETMAYDMLNGVLKSVSKLPSYTGSHSFVYFPTSFFQITFKHIRKDDWIALGGDGTHVTALAIGDPWSIRLIDLGATNGTAVDITVADKAAVGDLINLSWAGDTIVAKKNKNDGTGWLDWFSVNLANYTALSNYKIQKRFGAVTPMFPQDLLANVVATPIGMTSLADRVTKLEEGTSGGSIWNGKAWNAVGDSITQQGKYISPVANSLGLTATNCGLSSSTMAVNNSYLQNKSVYERVAGINGNTAYANADLWSIFAGVNDWLYRTPVGTIDSTDTATFYGALKATVENILGRSNVPKLILFTPLQSNRNGANQDGVTMNQYRQAIKAVGDYYSVPVLDLYGIGGLNPLNLNQFTGDGIHPNDLGTSYYYTKIVSAIKNL